MAEINNFIPRGNDFGLEVRLNTRIGENPPEAYDLTGATDVRLALTGHGMRVFATGVEVSDTNLISGTIPGRALLLGLYGIEVTCVLDHKHKRFAVNDIIEVVDEIPADSDDTAEGEGGGLQVTITIVQTVLTITGPAGADGQPGAPGQDGHDGQDGADGYSPTIEVTDITGGHRVSVTDVNGTQTFDVMDGEDGQPGADGFSPTASVSKSGKVATISITDKNGTTTATVSDGEDGHDGQDGAPGQNGQDGQDGQDGVSPVITVTDITGGHRISITDANGTTNVDVMDGTPGAAGPQGEAGPRGPQGLQGEQGNSGYTGAAGELEVRNTFMQPTATSAISSERASELNERTLALEGYAVYKPAAGDQSGKYVHNTTGFVWDNTDYSVSVRYKLLKGQTVILHLPGTPANNSLAIAVADAQTGAFKSNSAGSINWVSGTTLYSYTAANSDMWFAFTFKTSEGFFATVFEGDPVADIVGRLGGKTIAFDQAFYYTYANGTLTKSNGSLTGKCSTAAIPLAGKKNLFYTGGVATYNGYFCAIFLNASDNLVATGLLSREVFNQGVSGNFGLSMIDVLPEVPAGATKVIFQTDLANFPVSGVVYFEDVPYDAFHEEYWRQDFYGVKGDGQTDDTAALQALINNSHGEVRIRKGDYLISSTLTINTRYIRKFNGNGSTIKVTADIPAITLRGYQVGDASPSGKSDLQKAVAGAIIEDVCFMSSDPTVGTGLAVKECFMPIIRGCYFHDIGTAISFIGSNRNAIVEGNHIWCCLTGIGLGDSSTAANLHQINIVGNHISYCAKCIAAVNVTQLANVQITGNDIEVSSDYPSATPADNCCIYLKGASNAMGEVEISGNTVQGHGTATAIIDIANTGNSTLNDYTIVGNHISNAVNGIRLSNVYGVAIAGNSYRNVTCAVLLEGTVNDIAIAGECCVSTNKFVESDSAAALTGVSVTGCVARGTVKLSGASQDYLSVVGNNLRGKSVTLGTATHKQEANNI